MWVRHVTHTQYLLLLNANSSYSLHSKENLNLKVHLLHHPQRTYKDLLCNKHSAAKWIISFIPWPSRCCSRSLNQTRCELYWEQRNWSQACKTVETGAVASRHNLLRFLLLVFELSRDTVNIKQVCKGKHGCALLAAKWKYVSHSQPAPSRKCYCGAWRAASHPGEGHEELLPDQPRILLHAAGREGWQC